MLAGAPEVTVTVTDPVFGVFVPCVATTVTVVVPANKVAVNIGDALIRDDNVPYNGFAAQRYDTPLVISVLLAAYAFTVKVWVPLV